MTTREGNSVYQHASPFRMQNSTIVREYKSHDLCADCKHLGDMCKAQERIFIRVVKTKIKPTDIIAADGIGRSWVIQCKGFEQL